jgi:hypothetical protein
MSSREAGAMHPGIEVFDIAASWGPVWDHTLCALLNDLRVCARYAR